MADGEHGSQDDILTMRDMIPAPVRNVTHQIEFTDAERLGPGASRQRQPINHVLHPLDAEVNSNQGRLYFHGAPWPLQHRWFLSNDSEYLWPAPRPFDAFFTILRYCNFIVCNKAVPETASWIWKNKNWIFASSINFSMWCGHFSGRQFSGGARQVQSYTPHRAKRKSSLEASGAEKGCPWYDDRWSSWMLEESLNTLTAWDCICRKPFANLSLQMVESFEAPSRRS